MVLQAYNPAMWETEPGNLGVRGQPQLLSTLKTSLDYMRPPSQTQTMNMTGTD